MVRFTHIQFSRRRMKSLRDEYGWLDFRRVNGTGGKVLRSYWRAHTPSGPHSVGGLAIRSLRLSKQARVAYQILRTSFGGAILLGLEVLVAADLVRTVAVAPTLENVAILGLIVLIRTVLSFSLEIEIEGVALAARNDERSQLRCSCRQTQRRN